MRRAPKARKAAKRTQRRPVEWGYENGQQVVVRAAGRLAQDLPADRLHGLRDAIADMSEVVPRLRDRRRAEAAEAD